MPWPSGFSPERLSGGAESAARFIAPITTQTRLPADRPDGAARDAECASHALLAVRLAGYQLTDEQNLLLGELRAVMALASAIPAGPGHWFRSRACVMRRSSTVARYDRYDRYDLFYIVLLKYGYLSTLA